MTCRAARASGNAASLEGSEEGRSTHSPRAVGSAEPSGRSGRSRSWRAACLSVSARGAHSIRVIASSPGQARRGHCRCSSEETADRRPRTRRRGEARSYRRPRCKAVERRMRVDGLEFAALRINDRELCYHVEARCTDPLGQSSTSPVGIQ